MRMTLDTLWKKILTELFPDFLAFYFPEIHADIDFSHGYVFLEKELQKIMKGSLVGRKIVDKLVKVFLKDGAEKWLLIHIEIQGYPEEEFTERMYTYNYRIFDLYRREVISLAVLTDDDEHYRPDEFRISRWGFRLIFQFPIIKLIDFRSQWSQLQKSENPFAFITSAFLKTLETKGNDKERYSWKKYFVKELYEQGLDRATIWSVYTFIDWMMQLPEELEEKLYKETHEIEEEKDMPLLSIAEKRGRKKGIKEGIEKGMEKGIQKGIKQGKIQGLVSGLQQAILDIIEIKFGGPESDIREKILSIRDTDKLEQLREQLKKSQSLDEARELIETILAQ